MTSVTIEQLRNLRGKDNLLLLGVTGGIASGKTTVANMLKEMGAPIIDFDVLAREVVEPGRPAWKQIVDYFGEQVLQEDRYLDRKKLSKIVFRDFEKRKRLEKIVHPRTFEEYANRVNEIAHKDPNAVIQVVIPLVIELNLQDLFHKILVVHIPQEKQIERIIERDGISKEEAANMLKAQLPIDEKVRCADFVIHNEGQIEETRKQVEQLWQSLKKIQKERTK